MSRNVYKTALLVFFLLIIGGLFCWYELRPAKVKHDCSWHKVVDAAIPAISKEEADASKVAYDKCIEDNNKKKEEANKNGTAWDKFNLSEYLCDHLKKYERPFVPERTWYREAKDEEYDFCLHEKGL